jgi:xylose isomerase
MNIAVARLLQDWGYRRWFGHDMQVRAYDNERQGIERVVRSIVSWHACEEAAKSLDAKNATEAPGREGNCESGGSH